MSMDQKIPTKTKILYGSGDFGYSMTNSIIAALFPIFMMDVVGVTPALAAAALFIGRSWDYVNDPIVGYLSDRTRTRWGRRRPWLLFGSLPFALTFILLWLRPTFITTETGLLIFFAAVYLIYEASATTVYMPYFALTPELTQDYDERTQLTSFRMLFNIIGGLTAYTLPMLVIGSMIPQNADRVVLMNSGRVEQIGTPAEVYDQPATPFVHRFLGNVNLFHGRVSGHGLGIGDQTLASTIPTHLDQGSAAVAYVRPHELELLPEASSQGLRARVERLLPMGSRIRVELRGEDGLNGALFEAELTKEMVQSLQPGQTVRLSARQSQIYPDYEI